MHNDELMGYGFFQKAIPSDHKQLNWTLARKHPILLQKFI